MKSTVIVTGAGSGIGWALSLEAVARGHEVIGIEANADRATALNAALGDRGVCHVADVRWMGDLERVAEACAATPRQIGLVFANAGVLRAGRPWRQSAEDRDLVIDVNVKGVLNTLHCFAPLLLAQSEPSAFVFTGSPASFTSSPGFEAYAASKHAVLAIASAFAADVKRNSPQVRSVLLCPGAVRTAIADDDVAGPDNAAQAATRQRAQSGDLPEVVARHAFDAIERGDEMILLGDRIGASIAERAELLSRGRLS